MKRGMAVSVVIVLLVGSHALGQIEAQYQNWNLRLQDSMSFSGGQTDVSTIQGIGTLSVQGIGINPDLSGDPTATAGQGIGAALYQDGSIGTRGALVTLDQDLHILGASWGAYGPGQAQTVGDLNGPVGQYQGVSVIGREDMTKGEGSTGNVDGLNIAAFGMGQAAANTCAGGLQLSLILGGQYSELDGAAQASGELHTDMTATIQQLQTANPPLE
ncbi:MAG: hypothetical protein JW955_22960 [Sedimentisphaerales bacterium]|nr:hypothetical protein [Sedimentisphaerales bacterium]